jgi:hypothetical protein
MTWPLSTNYPITTAYGKRGSYWSCNENSSGNGVHTGCDFAAPNGTPVYATIAGDVRHRNYGSAFGNHQVAISPDSDQPFGNGEVFYAHMRKRVADGTKVSQGDWIGEVGSEGNVSGPHLHYEFHPNTKGSWSCNVHADPAPTLGGSTNTYVTKDIYTNKLGYGEPTNGDSSSDTIKELQELLNRTTLVGGQNLTVNGKYDNDTDEEVRLWQEQICGDNPDPAKQSYLGPSQTKKMFGDQYTIHDAGLPAIASETPDTVPPEGGNTNPGTNLSVIGQRFVNAAAYVQAPVYYEDDWDNDDIAGNGTWSPKYVILHHTAGTNSLNWILYGGEYQPVRLANFLVDKDGTLHVCAARKAYHAGKGGPLANVSKDSMNDYSIGIEIESLGQTQDLTNDQITTVSQLTNGWLDTGNLNSDVVYNHKDWSTTGKTDTRYDIAWWRDKIDGVATPPPTQPSTPNEPDNPIVVGSATYWHAYSGKPSGNLFVDNDAGYVALDAKVPAPPISGNEEHMLYINVAPNWSGTSMGEIRVKYVRDGGDDTAYQDFHVKNAEESFLITHVHFEDGQKNVGGKWYVNVGGGITSANIGTRYCKTHVIAVDDVSVASAAAHGAYTAATSQLIALLNWLRELLFSKK